MDFRRRNNGDNYGRRYCQEYTISLEPQVQIITQNFQSDIFSVFEIVRMGNIEDKNIAAGAMDSLKPLIDKVTANVDELQKSFMKMTSDVRKLGLDEVNLTNKLATLEDKYNQYLQKIEKIEKSVDELSVKVQKCFKQFK